MATYSSDLAWRIPGTGEPVGLPSMTSHRVGHDRSDLAAAAAWSWLLNICAYEVLITQSCPTLCYPKDCSPPGSSVQARTPEAAISFSRGASQPRDWTPVSCDSCIAGGFFTTEPSRKPILHSVLHGLLLYKQIQLDSFMVLMSGPIRVIITSLIWKFTMCPELFWTLSYTSQPPSGMSNSCAYFMEKET